MKIEDMTPITGSSQIARVGHDGVHFYVLFHGRKGAPGPLYRYFEHGPEHVAGHVKAASAGEYFGQHIRGKGGYEKVVAEG